MNAVVVKRFPLKLIHHQQAEQMESDHSIQMKNYHAALTQKSIQ